MRTSELNWTNKNINPNKVTALNDDVEVKVIEIDDEKDAFLSVSNSVKKTLGLILNITTIKEIFLIVRLNL